MTVNLNPSSKRAINDLKSLTVTLVDQVGILQKFEQDLEVLIDKQAELEAKVAQAEIDAKEQIRAIDVQKKLDIKENSLRAFLSLAKELDYRVLTQEEFSELNNIANKTQDEVNALVQEAKDKAERGKHAALATQKLEHEKETIGLKAEVEQLNKALARQDSEIIRLTTQLERLNQVLEVANQKSAITQTIGK